MKNVALAGEARSAVACAESCGTCCRYLRERYVPRASRNRVESSWQVGIQGFWPGRQRPKGHPGPSLQAWVAARDVSGVCALSVHFITASKIKLGPDGMYGQQGLGSRPDSHQRIAQHNTEHTHSLTVLRFGPTALRTRHQISVPSPSHSLAFEGASRFTRCRPASPVARMLDARPCNAMLRRDRIGSLQTKPRGRRPPAQRPLHS